MIVAQWGIEQIAICISLVVIDQRTLPFAVKKRSFFEGEFWLAA
jgi:hypothetical protein